MVNRWWSYGAFMARIKPLIGITVPESYLALFQKKTSVRLICLKRLNSAMAGAVRVF